MQSTGVYWIPRLSGDKVELGLVPLGSLGMGASSMLILVKPIKDKYRLAGFWVCC
jgi:hypothetical protein